jgi:hypothetical protein
VLTSLSGKSAFVNEGAELGRVMTRPNFCATVPITGGILLRGEENVSGKIDS